MVKMKKHVPISSWPRPTSGIHKGVRLRTRLRLLQRTPPRKNIIMIFHADLAQFKKIYKKYIYIFSPRDVSKNINIQIIAYFGLV